MICEDDEESARRDQSREREGRRRSEAHLPDERSNKFPSERILGIPPPFDQLVGLQALEKSLSDLILSC